MNKKNKCKRCGYNFEMGSIGYQINNIVLCYSCYKIFKALEKDLEEYKKEVIDNFFNNTGDDSLCLKIIERREKKESDGNIKVYEINRTILWENKPGLKSNEKFTLHNTSNRNERSLKELSELMNIYYMRLNRDKDSENLIVLTKFCIDDIYYFLNDKKNKDVLNNDEIKLLWNIIRLFRCFDVTNMRLYEYEYEYECEV